MKKRILTILVLAVMLVGLLSVCVATADTLYATVTSSNGYGVRLRSGPGKNYDIITKYPVGTVVTVLQHGTGWSQIQVGETIGWMQNDYLIFGQGNPTEPTTYTYNAYVTSENGLRVWLRSAPGGKKIALYSPGTPVAVLSYDSSWCQIAVQGRVGYMMTQFITVQAVDTTPYILTGISVDTLNPQSGDVVVAAIQPDAATASYTWTLKKDGKTTKLSNESSLTVNDSYRGGILTVTATGIGRYSGTVSFSTNVVAEDSWLSAVMLSNALPYVGEVLTASTVPTTADVLYSWRSNGTEVSTDPEYTVQESDIGKLIQVKVTGLGVNQGVASDTAASVVTAMKSLQYITVSNEHPVVGEPLTVTAYPANLDVAFVWYADGEIVSTSNTYTVQIADLGKKLEIRATALEPYSGYADICTARVANTLVHSAKLSTTAPVVGDTIQVYVAPLDSSVTCEWYLDGITKIPGSNTTKLYIKPEYEGHTISALAKGSGVYGGMAGTGESEPVVAYPKVVAVKINNTNPIVGNHLKAEVEFYPSVTDPSKRASLINQMTFLWRVGTTTKSAENTDTYEVIMADVGYPIQVYVVNGPDGAVYNLSSDYTNAVALTKAITGVNIYNATAATDPRVINPEMGHKLVACSDPDYADSEGYVDYLWFIDKTQAGIGETFVIPETYNNGTEDVTTYGKTITVVAVARLPYMGYAVSTTAPVTFLVKPNLEFALPAPVRGNNPTYYTTGTLYIPLPFNLPYANVEAYVEWGSWDGSTFTILPLDESGAFLPNTKYDARLIFELPEGFTYFNANISVNGNKIPEGNVQAFAVCYTDFAATEGNMPINQLYITDIPFPVAGEKAVTRFETTQYSATVNWTKGVRTDRTIENVNDYECMIYLTPKEGYSLNELAENSFIVSTADVTKYSAGSDVVQASFRVNRKLHLETDTATVYLDGTKDRMVLCSATLDGVEAPEVKWSVQGDISQSGTYITSDGLLIVDKNETVGKELTIVADARFDGVDYSASAKVWAEAGSSYEGIKVVFQSAPKSMTIGGKAETIQFKAYAINSDEGVEYSVLPENVTSSDTKIDRNTGVLTVAVDEKADYLTVMARSKEDSTVFAKWEVTVVHKDTKIVEDTLLGYQWKKILITDVPNGTSKEAIEAMLPATVDITTEKETASSASIEWDLSGYDPSKTSEESYNFIGAIKLPANVKNPNSIDLSVSIGVDVLAKGVVKTLVSIDKPASITSVSNGTPLTDIAVPDNVTLNIMTDGTPGTTTAEVVWDLGGVVGYDPAITAASQTFTIKGKVKLSASIENPDDVALETAVTVTVLEYGVTNDLVAIDWSGIGDTVLPNVTNLNELENALASSVSIQTNFGNMLANLSWSFNGFVEEEVHEQTVIATATVNLPVGVTNNNGVELSKTITITIQAQPADVVILGIEPASATLYAGDTDAVFNLNLKNEGAAKATNICLELPENFSTTYVNGSAALIANEEYTIVIHADPSKLLTGSYPIIVTYEGGETSKLVESIELVIIPKLTAIIVAEPAPLVPEGTEVTLHAIVVGGYDIEKYEWETTPENVDSISYVVNSDATIALTVTDTEGHTASTSIGLKVYTEMTAGVSKAPSTPISPKTPVTLSVHASNGSGIYSYLWETGETTQSITVTPGSNASYHVKVTDGITELELSVPIEVIPTV